jgi:CDP-paratose 2-epimerase
LEYYNSFAFTMRVCITGICGFVGCSLAAQLLNSIERLELYGIDSLVRPGSESNRARLRDLGCKLYHGDIRQRSDLELIPQVDWVIDAAANPSVLAGITGSVSSQQVIEHNLLGTVNILEFCRRNAAGLVLLSTSRVYSIMELSALPLETQQTRFVFPENTSAFPGVSAKGVNERFSTTPPISLYGATKLSSEVLALEYASAFDFPVWINRCGVMAGAGQFGTAEQGIFSYWIHAWRSKQTLKYIGFEGSGRQVRDALHPGDLGQLITRQLQSRNRFAPNHIWNISGGSKNSMSLAELSQWCSERFGSREINQDRKPRQYDIPWLILDSATAQNDWGWQPETSLESILEEIAAHADKEPDWLRNCGALG